MKHPTLFDFLPKDKDTIPSPPIQDLKGVFEDGLCFISNIDSESRTLLGLALTIKGIKTAYINLSDKKKGFSTEALRILRPYFEDPSITKISHDFKSQYSALNNSGIALRGTIKDTMIASYLLNPNKTNHSLKGIAEGYLKDTFDIGNSTEGSPIEQVAQDFGQRVLCIYRLQDMLFRRLSEEGMDRVYYEIEMPVIEILAKMQSTGIKIDTTLLSDLSKELQTQLVQIEQKVFALAGEQFNINSHQQLSNILFNKLKLRPTKKTKTGYSTDNSTLQELSAYHELPQQVVNYRLLFKLKSTFVDGLIPLVDPKTKRIYTTLHQTSTATGRLSSSDPNLQNIPIRGEWGLRIRDAFIAEEGSVLMSADYSQIELRVLAHLSSDQRLIEAFKNDKDIHTTTASVLFKVPEDKVDREMRRVAKVVNFGIIYGMSPYGLSEALKISTSEATDYIERYFSLHSGVKHYLQQIVKTARQTGFVSTLFGRKRWIQDINSSNTNLRQQAERIALNTPIQGTAADLIKLAMIRIDKVLIEAKLKTKMLLQIHDELLFEIPKGEIEVAMGIVKTSMEEAAQLAVPLKVEIKYGRSWGETH